MHLSTHPLTWFLVAGLIGSNTVPLAAHGEPKDVKVSDKAVKDSYEAVQKKFSKTFQLTFRTSAGQFA